jgi:hypothetical protein
MIWARAPLRGLERVEDAERVLRGRALGGRRIQHEVIGGVLLAAGAL